MRTVIGRASRVGRGSRAYRAPQKAKLWNTKTPPQPKPPADQPPPRQPLWRRIRQLLISWRGFEVIAAVIAIILAAAAAIYAYEANEHARLTSAWEILVQPAPGNSGKKDALETLHGFGATLIGIDLSCQTHASLPSADTECPEWKGVWLEGVTIPNADLRQADLSGASLRRADLSGAFLRRADLSGASLENIDLSGAYLWGTDLSGASLWGTDLSGASLWGADLSGGADLGGADLSGASL